MKKENNMIILEPNENYIPTGLPGGFFIYNAVGDEEIYFAEQNVIELFGCETMEELRELTGNSFKGMVHPEDLSKIENDIQAQTFTSERRHDYVRYRIITKQGEIRYIEDFGHLLHGEDGNKYFYVYIVDVDKDEFYNRSRNSFAETQIFSLNQNTDRLTGLMNMPSFYEAVQKIMKDDAVRKNNRITFVHFNIVNFKMFNENYGFHRGDDLLCRMAYSIRNEFGDAKIARFSNDHFVVCTMADNVKERVKNIHAAMVNILAGARIEIRAGIYELEDTCKEVGIACDHARIACNTVKKRYDLIYGVYDVNLYERLRKQQYIVDKVDEAIEKGYIKVFYQPVIRVATEKICGYEALARWDDPQAGLLSPADFITTLEEYHEIHKLDCYIVKKVFEDIAEAIDKGEPVVPVSVNLSRLDFELCDVPEIIEDYRERYGVMREMLDIEITESALNEDSEKIKTGISRLRKEGYQIWIDDFGSGYSSLNHLLDYEFDVLKLDLEFLRSYNRNPRARELIKYIVLVANKMGFVPLQEGVETAEHFAFLKEIGCVRAQGYYFAKPMEINESRKFTREKGLQWEKQGLDR